MKRVTLLIFAAIIASVICNAQGKTERLDEYIPVSTSSLKATQTYVYSEIEGITWDY